MEDAGKKEINSLSLALIRYFLESNNIKFDEVYNEAPILEEMILNQAFISHSYFLKLVEKSEKKFNDPHIIEKMGQTASCLRPNGLIKNLAFRLLNVRKIISYYPKYFKYFYSDSELRIIENGSKKTVIEIYFPDYFRMTETDRKFVRGLLTSIPVNRKEVYSVEETVESENIYTLVFKWPVKERVFYKKLAVYEAKINGFLRALRKSIRSRKKVNIKKISFKPRMNLMSRFKVRIPKFKIEKISLIFKEISSFFVKIFKRKKTEIIDLRKTIHEEILEYESKFRDKEEEKEELLKEPAKVLEEVEVKISENEMPADIQDKFEKMKQKLKEEIEFSQKMRNLNNKLINKIEYLEKINLDLSNEKKADKITLERLKEDFKNAKEQLEGLKIKKNTFVYDIIQNLKGPALRIVTSLEIVKNNFSTQDEDQNDFMKEAVAASHEILSLVGYSIEFNKEVENQEIEIKSKVK